MTTDNLIPLLIQLQRHEAQRGSSGIEEREHIVNYLRSQIIAPVVNGTCRACNIAVSRGSLQGLRLVTGDSLVPCSNCGTYIYTESEELAAALTELDLKLSSVTTHRDQS